MDKIFGLALVAFVVIGMFTAAFMDKGPNSKKAKRQKFGK